MLWYCFDLLHAEPLLRRNAMQLTLYPYRPGPELWLYRTDLWSCVTSEQTYKQTFFKKSGEDLLHYIWKCSLKEALSMHHFILCRGKKMSKLNYLKDTPNHTRRQQYDLHTPEHNLMECLIQLTISTGLSIHYFWKLLESRQCCQTTW